MTKYNQKSKKFTQSYNGFIFEINKYSNDLQFHDDVPIYFIYEPTVLFLSLYFRRWLIMNYTKLFKNYK